MLLQCSHTHAMKTQVAPDFLDKVLQKKNLKLNTKKNLLRHPSTNNKSSSTYTFWFLSNANSFSYTFHPTLKLCFCNCHFFGNDHFPCEFSGNKSSFTFFLFLPYLYFLLYPPPSQPTIPTFYKK